MPKQKTHKGAAKRLKRTATGRLKRNMAGRRHLATAMSAKRKRHLRGGSMIAEQDFRRFDYMVP